MTRTKFSKKAPDLSTVVGFATGFALWGCRLGFILGLVTLSVSLVVAALGTPVDIGSELVRATRLFIGLAVSAALIGLLIGLGLKYCGVLAGGGKPSAEARNEDGQG